MIDIPPGNLRAVGRDGSECRRLQMVSTDAGASASTRAGTPRAAHAEPAPAAGPTPARLLRPPPPYIRPSRNPTRAGTRQQPPPPPPAFGQILTPQQQAEFRRSYQQSAQFARQTLSQLSGRALSRDQADTANRIRSFLSQADEAQSKDPSVAAQLARRAELLARDLLNSLR